MFFRQEDMKNRITPIDITHMHTDVECGGVSHRYRRCTRMLRAEGKDVIRNLKKKSVVICDICGRLISSYRWWLQQIVQISTNVGYINLIIRGICGRNGRFFFNLTKEHHNPFLIRLRQK